jgi:hypothetical protein
MEHSSPPGSEQKAHAARSRKVGVFDTITKGRSAKATAKDGVGVYDRSDQPATSAGMNMGMIAIVAVIAFVILYFVLFGA